MLYSTPNGDTKVEVFLHNETIWLPQKRIAELFGVQRPAVTKHLKNIFESGELNEKEVCSILELPTQHGAIEGKIQIFQTKFYNLDAILSVGYRVNSSQATQFRIWASKILREYIIKGFAMDDDRLKNGQYFGKDYFQELLEFNEYEILENSGNITHSQAEEKAFAEYDEFNKTQVIHSDFERVINKVEKVQNKKF